MRILRVLFAEESDALNLNNNAYTYFSLYYYYVLSNNVSGSAVKVIDLVYRFLRATLLT